MATIVASIVINNHNYGRFLGDAIVSALAQTYPHVEVIVLDDGSADDSRKVIEGYGERVRAIFKSNGGQASALNAGFAVCSGDVVLFLDSDDVLFPAAVETVVREWRNGLALVFFPLEKVDADGRGRGQLTGGITVADPALRPFSFGSPMSGNAFCRKLLEKVMPIPEDPWRLGADRYLISASSVLGGVKLTPIPLAKYRLHGKSASATEPSLTEARREIRSSFIFHREMERLLGDKIPPLEVWLAADTRQWLYRIRSLRESRAEHPLPADTLPRLAWHAIGAAWRRPEWNSRRSIAYTILILGYALLPGRLVRALRRAETYATGPWLRPLLGRHKRAARAGRLLPNLRSSRIGTPHAD